MNKSSRKGLDRVARLMYTGDMTDTRIRTYADNEERTRRFLDNVQDFSQREGLEEYAQILAICAVASSNLAIAAAILQRPQPDFGTI